MLSVELSRKGKLYTDQELSLKFDAREEVRLRAFRNLILA